MHQILLYLLRCSKALVPEEEIANMLQWEELEWQKYAEECKGMIVTNPGTVRSGIYTSKTESPFPGLDVSQKQY
jgi:ribonuclease-3